MFVQGLNMSEDYSSCFVVVLREMYGKADIYQTDYSIHSLQT